jgi:hypothetical protein
MALLSKVQRGQPITAELFNNMIDAIRECQLNSVVGSGGTVATFKRGPGGTTISINSQNQQGASQSQEYLCPFTPTIITTTGGRALMLSAGTINGIIPINMFSSFPITDNANNYYYLRCASDGKLLTSAEIRQSTTIPSYYAARPDAAPEVFNKVIAVVVAGGAAFRATPCADLTAKITASVQEDNVTYVAGTRNFVQYYSWV